MSNKIRWSASAEQEPEAPQNSHWSLSSSSCFSVLVPRPWHSSSPVAAPFGQIYFFLATIHAPPPSSLTFERGRRGGVGFCGGKKRGGLVLRGRPSANQRARGKEGLNEANDPTAITAERSTLNIGIPVWNECKGLGGGAAAARARRAFVPDNWSSSRLIIYICLLFI